MCANENKYTCAQPSRPSPPHPFHFTSQKANSSLTKLPAILPLFGTKELCNSIVRASLPSVQYIVNRVSNADAVHSLVNKASTNGNTPLHHAIWSSQCAISRFLIQHGANVDALTAHGDSCVMLAACVGKVALLKVLLENGADVSLRTQAGNTALHIASVNGWVNCCKILLEFGADVFAANDKKQNALHLAVAKGHHRVVASLLRYAHSIDRRHAKKEKENMKQKKEQKVDEHRHKQRESELQELSSALSSRKSGFLLKPLYRMSPSRSTTPSPPSSPPSPLSIVSTQSASPSLPSSRSSSRTACMLRRAIVHTRRASLLRSLVESNTTLNETPLLLAAKLQQRDCLKVLLTYGASLSATDNMGKSPYVYAQENQDWETMIAIDAFLHERKQRVIASQAQNLQRCVTK